MRSYLSINIFKILKNCVIEKNQQKMVTLLGKSLLYIQKKSVVTIHTDNYHFSRANTVGIYTLYTGK